MTQSHSFSSGNSKRFSCEGLKPSSQTRYHAYHDCCVCTHLGYNAMDWVRPKQKQCLWFLVSACVFSERHVCIWIYFLFFAMKQCEIAARIAGSIGILLCYVLNKFFTKV